MFASGGLHTIVFVYQYFLLLQIFQWICGGIGNERSERACFECIENVSFKEDKDFLLKLFFSLRDQLEYNVLTGKLYHEAVSNS